MQWIAHSGICIPISCLDWKRNGRITNWLLKMVHNPGLEHANLSLRGVNVIYHVCWQVGELEGSWVLLFSKRTIYVNFHELRRVPCQPVNVINVDVLRKTLKSPIKMAFLGHLFRTRGFPWRWKEFMFLSRLINWVKISSLRQRKDFLSDIAASGVTVRSPSYAPLKGKLPVRNESMHCFYPTFCFCSEWSLSNEE